MKKIYLSLMAVAALTLAACGGGNKSNEQAEAPAGGEAQQEQVAQEGQKFESISDVNKDNYVELVKTLCGVDPTPGDGMTLDNAYGSPGNANMKFKGAKGIEERDLQKLYFERCQAVADDGTIYKIKSDPEKGIQKGDPFSSFDDFKGINWAYEYKGEIVNCCVQKPGGMKNADSFELRFGR